MTDVKVRRHVYLFRPRFVGPILAGTKCQTVRSPRKRQPVPGDLLDLRAWLVKPYRSPQVKVLRATCLSVEPIVVSVGVIFTVEIDGRLLSVPESFEFAVADGFHDTMDLVRYYFDRQVERFDGVLIRWAPGGPT